MIHSRLTSCTACAAAILDADMIGPEPAALAGLRLLGEEADRDADGDVAGGRAVGEKLFHMPLPVHGGAPASTGHALQPLDQPLARGEHLGLAVGEQVAGEQLAGQPQARRGWCREAPRAPPRRGRSRAGRAAAARSAPGPPPSRARSAPPRSRRAGRPAPRTGADRAGPSGSAAAVSAVAHSIPAEASGSERRKARLWIELDREMGQAAPRCARDSRPGRDCPAPAPAAAAATCRRGHSRPGRPSSGRQRAHDRAMLAMGADGDDDGLGFEMHASVTQCIPLCAREGAMTIFSRKRSRAAARLLSRKARQAVAPAARPSPADARIAGRARQAAAAHAASNIMRATCPTASIPTRSAIPASRSRTRSGGSRNAAAGWC